ncbi:MAG: M48 family metalloprotease, partial [Chlamydiia bacterium]|nr:M48 family metalloprotease [Chlamydiia bacterium]
MMFREVFLLVFSVFILAFASEAPGEGTFGKTAALLIFSGAMLITYGLVYLLPKQKNLPLVILLASTALLFLVFPLQDPFSLHITLLSIWGLAFVIGGYGIHKRALLSVRFILPFTIPYLALTVTADYFPPYLSLAALAATLLIFPWFLKLFWGFEPLENPYLKERLEAFCRRAKFRHRGLYTWKVQNHTITAAIVGALPSLRYVLFSRALIDAFTPEEIEAILAHEIGHAKYYHLWLYPLLVLGILVIGLLLIDLPFWPAFLLYLLLTTLYFRFVFGYFSRLFERQA